MKLITLGLCFSVLIVCGLCEDAVETSENEIEGNEIESGEFTI